MKGFTPEISWHNRQPALSLDIAPPIDKDGFYRVATGGNDCRVYIWLIQIIQTKPPEIRIRAGLRRHQRSVGAVRFSSQHLLASGDDDGYIYIWKQRDNQNENEQIPNSFSNDDEFEDLESWEQKKVLRGHIEDICDLSWSKDGKFLLSGSVDNTAILWEAEKGTKLWLSDSMKGYVQGVAIDPNNQFMAAISSSRTLRIFNYDDRRLLYAKRRMDINGELEASFCDDTVQTFCRRLEFSPDGQFLIAPTSCLPGGVNKKPTNAALVFKRGSFNKVSHYYVTGKEVALCIRFSPVVYKLKESSTNFWDIPYRIVFAIATSRSVLIYDSQQSTPIGYASQIHLARLTDLSWSRDGKLLMVSSYDGYSTLLTFEDDEFGEVYTGPMQMHEKSSTVEEVTKKGRKRLKTTPESATMWRFLSRRNE